MTDEEVIPTEEEIPPPPEGETEEPEGPPHPSTLDPHTLVDMRVRYDPRFLGDDAELLPTTDPNIKYVRIKGEGQPTKEKAESTELQKPKE